MIGIVSNIFRWVLVDFEVFKGFKSPIVHFTQNLIFNVLDDNLDSSVRSGIVHRALFFN